MAQINKPNQYFNTVLWTGNGTDDRSITGVGFKPDWVWYKERSNVGDHTVHDVVRGAGERLFTASTSLESLDANSLQAFETDGFQIGTNTDVNGNSETYVAWNWLAGGTASSNTDGSITATVSANTTAGFSIIDFTGNETNSSVGHGLGVEPSMFIMKRYTDDGYSTSTEWYTYHKSLASDKYLTLQSTASTGTNDGSLWNTSTPVTSSVINIGFNANSNHTGNKTIIYAFAEKKGFSKFGSYTGNGNADGTFIYTGFKPAFIITKPTANISSWNMTDVKRSTYNDGSLERLKANTSDAETSTSNFSILSNGFKLRTTDNDYNPSGGNVIYMCFAESPLVGTNNIPATAR